ncbi:hypothetical protein HDV03_001917 [Kappamyces sp. JEL0829]|nr:hypothetical protein HDV03_001917 [Kappamyces sp. JEL0829]
MKLTLLALTASLALAAGPGEANTGCVLLHCGGKAVSCQFNSSCKKTLDCSNGCAKGNLTCAERCVTQYGTAQFDDLTVCIQTNKCITPYPHIDFPVPTKVATSFALSSFLGKWNVLAGLDAGLDCYDKQAMDFTAIGSGALNHDLEITFPEGLKQINSTMRASPNAGIFSLTYTLGGGGQDTWYVLDTNPAYTLLVYLGSNQLSNYRGGYVLSKTLTGLTSDQINSINAALSASGSGVAFKDFCSLKP